MWSSFMRGVRTRPPDTRGSKAAGGSAAQATCPSGLSSTMARAPGSFAKAPVLSTSTRMAPLDSKGA